MSQKQRMMEELKKKEEEDPKDLEPENMFLQDTFKEYIKEKYLLENPEILANNSILQMVYALEWYDIPRTAYSELIEYHPYLTVGDYDKLKYINMQHRIENLISMSLFAAVANRLIFTKFPIFNKRYTRFPTALAIGGVATYVFNLFILRPMYLHDLEEMGLADKYFFLDLNADLMKEDLEQLGFKINAKHFDLEQTEQRLNQQ